MLFNSYPFIFAFLPITLLGFFFIGSRAHRRAVVAWLVGASLFFYGWWNPAYLGLVIGSMLFNYAVGIGLSSPHTERKYKKTILTFGVAANLVTLGYFKYANFFVANLNWGLDTNFVLGTIILPLGISFFTFQQIAYLVDAYRGETKEYNFLDYCLFVTFFPQWIAGPIVHHAEVLPQFENPRVFHPKQRNMAVGLTIFAIGLFKKTVVADSVAVYATPIFSAATEMPLTFLEAWIGALAYTFQLYFDFSGYSDMAIGLGQMFNIKLPLNFYSPYKATNIIEFWRRWHMTLSRFLREYLYIPLGGNRQGPARRYINLLITMLLGGLWHGAGWTFVLWGGLHGMYLVINHTWRTFHQTLGLTHSYWWTRDLSRVLTFLAVVVGWVFFRAANVDTAINMLTTMAGGNGFSFADSATVHVGFSDPLVPLTWICGLLLAVRFLPNTHEIMRRFKATCDDYSDPTIITPDWLHWQPSLPWAVVCAALLLLATSQLVTNSEFLYFQF